MSNDDKRKKAAALRYDQKKEGAPRLIAKGAGKIAEKIIDLAKKYDIPIYEDGDLVKILSKLEINRQIPAELYQTVAEVLAFLYNTNKSFSKKLNRNS